jgi:WD40 repeat protein
MNRQALAGGRAQQPIPVVFGLESLMPSSDSTSSSPTRGRMEVRMQQRWPRGWFDCFLDRDGCYVGLWDARTGDLLGPMMKHEPSVCGARFFRRGKCLIAWGGDGAVRIWDGAQSGSLKCELRHDGWLTSEYDSGARNSRPMSGCSLAATEVSCNSGIPTPERRWARRSPRTADSRSHLFAGCIYDHELGE